MANLGSQKCYAYDAKLNFAKPRLFLAISFYVTTTICEIYNKYEIENHPV